MPVKKTGWKLVSPVLILVLICVAVSGLVALVNEITAPIVEDAADEKLRQTLVVVLPQATAFTEIPFDMENVVAVYQDDGGAGYVFVTTGKGYNGELTVMTALDNEGNILALSVDTSGETPNVGTRAGEASYTQQFIGMSGSVGSVDALSGATYSSGGVISAVNTALAAFAAIKEA